jgi:hypothetical protein
MKIAWSLATAVWLGLAVVAGCNTSGPPVPASSDPEGNDLVAGAVVAAVELGGGMRLYKIVHVDDYPDPVGHDLHMIAYDPKVDTFQDASNMRATKKEQMKIALDHILVQKHLFMKRDHRVVASEPVTEEELLPYKKSKLGR